MKRALAVALLVGVAPLSLQAATLTYKDLVKRLTDMEQIAVLPPAGEQGALASSYERKSQYDEATDKYIEWDANGDGYGGDGAGFIRKEGDRAVLADIQGAGCIWRLWSADPLKGKLSIYLDGAETPAVELSGEDYFNGKSEPFTRPNLVYLPKAKGANNYTPIPFQKSCKIVGDASAESRWGSYFQCNYTVFPKGTIVPTFKLPLSAVDSAALDEANRIMGQCGQEPAGKRPKQQTETKNVTVPAGGKKVVNILKGPQAITGLKVKLANFPSDADAQRTLLRQLTVSITWDAESGPAVWSPLGDFFATAGLVKPFQTLPVGLLEDGTFYCYWYMPFSSKAQIEVGNDGNQPATMTWEITSAPLNQPIQKLGRFHAKWHRDAFLPERKDREIDWTLLTTQGKGRYVGTQLHVWNPGGRWWGEGDEKFFVDGEKFPSTFGTGSEDYFGYAWCCPASFVQALHSQPVNESNRGHANLMRWHIADNIPFQKSFEGDIEKYFPTKRGTLYSAVAYWYLNAGGKDPYLPVPVSERIGLWSTFQEFEALETEFMKVSNKPLNAATVQNMETYGKNRWSLGQQMFWAAKGEGERLDLEFPWIYGPKKFWINARFTKGPNYGICQVSVNGQKIGEPFDAYAPSISAADQVELGEVEIKDGNNILTLETVGKNPNSKGCNVGLDYIKVIGK